jgi:PadR family transcriptional regulator PadR
MAENTFDLESGKAQMRKGLLELCALLVISKGEMYSSDILEKMKSAGLLIVEGTIYPLLSRLKSEGLLTYNWVESASGPPRKYYSLTASGRNALEQLKSTWRALSKSVESLIK